MESLLIATTAAIIILFIVSAAADFTAGLITLWQNAGAKTQLLIEAKPAIEQPVIANKVEPASALPDLWMLPVEEIVIALPDEQPSVKSQLLLAPAQVQIADLDWAIRNLPPVQMFTAELPDAIAMAKSRLPKVAPVLDLATQAQLAALGIRRCKKLASQLGVRGYGNLKLSQLVERLEGRVLQSQLVA